MSGNNDEESAVQELVIIRRRASDGDGGHHGGVWKIAYADFMTAMMAFFLVMWLINATDNKVLTQVATYFNPMRLTDRAPTPRGMYDADSGAPGQENEAGESKVKDGKAKSTKIGPVQQKMLEDAMFRDPYGTLEKLAQEAIANEPKEQRRASGGKHEQAEGTLAGGEAFRDPFDPEFRQSVAREVVIRSKQDAADAKDASVADNTSQGGKPAIDGGNPPAPPAAGDVAKDSQASERQSAAQNAAAKAAEQADAVKIEAEIRQAMGQVGAGSAPDIEVRVTEDGVLISLTDKADFGMFAIASAEPRPAMVAIMENIGKILKARQGKVVVRGHTDGRPFRSASYDNWRLSTARAHMAYYMLVRGGIDEKRFSRIEGHADRDLKVTADPEAAQNRRIEILLKEVKS
jgi:chemotaxis protein MotB